MLKEIVEPKEKPFNVNVFNYPSCKSLMTCLHASMTAFVSCYLFVWGRIFNCLVRRGHDSSMQVNSMPYRLFVAIHCEHQHIVQVEFTIMIFFQFSGEKTDYDFVFLLRQICMGFLFIFNAIVCVCRKHVFASIHFYQFSFVFFSQFHKFPFYLYNTQFILHVIRALNNHSYNR